MKTLKSYYLFYIFLILTSTSCDNEFTEINTNPNDPLTVPSNLLLGGTLRATANNMQSTFLAGESPLNWVQQLSKPQYNDGDLYKPRLGSIQSFWDQLYSQVIKDAKSFYVLAGLEGNSKLQGVSLIIQAHAFQLLTDSFGYIPFTEVGVDANFTPIYESPEIVYNGIIAMLTEAQALLNGDGEIDSSQDLIYHGDSELWKKFAGSLQFRAIMRASSATGYSVGSQLQDIVDSGNLFTSNDDEAKLQFLEADPNANPYYERLTLGGPARIQEWCVGENLVKMMDGTIFGVFDNRLRVYAKPASDGEYRGLPPGLSSNPGNIFTDPISEIGSAILEAETYCYFMSYSQINFLLAEASEKKFISGDAATYYSKGITSSFESYGADIENYPTSYLGGLAGLKQIAEQSYLSLYMQGYEAWAEQRRTGFPVLSPAQAGVISQIPSRFSYPGDEQSDNPANIASAISAQGSDLLTTPIWWMK